MESPAEGTGEQPGPTHTPNSDPTSKGDMDSTPGQAASNSPNDNKESAREEGSLEANERLSSSLPNGEAMAHHSLREQLIAIETELNLVDRLFGLQHWGFIWDSMFFMREMRQSYESIKRYKQSQKAKDNKMSTKPITPEEPESARQISTAAFSKGEPSRVSWVDLDIFLEPKKMLEMSIMSPIEAVINNKSFPTPGSDRPVDNNGDTIEAKEYQMSSSLGQPTIRGEEEVLNGHDKGEPDKDEHIDEEEGTSTSITALLHLPCLLGFIDDEIKPKLAYISSDSCRKILFHDLWHLFKQGHEVISQKEKQAYRVIRVQIPRHKDETPVTIFCAYIDFDGKHFGPVSVKFNISPFGGLRDIKSLPIYPLRLTKYTELRQNLIKRGKMLLDVSKFTPMYYMDLTLDTKDEIDSRVVVDFSEALADEQRQECTPAIDALQTGPDERGDEMSLTEYFVKSLIPDTAFGAPFLILAPRSLEETQGASEEGPTDEEFVIMTYRVFAVVLRSRKWGDLGTTARDVETELEKNFALVSRWGCILLLDEADVFLSARERTDFKRNGLVAVFLRVLEYYTGILFLTTNRIGDFDEAIASRIRVGLYYPELDELKTRNVFKLNLDLIRERFNRHGRKITFDASSIDDFAKRHFHEHKYTRWNERQIRNACQTALVLAGFDAHGAKTLGELDKDVEVELQQKYFTLVQTAYLGFARYLGDIRVTQGDRRAIDLRLRAKTDTPYQTIRSRFSVGVEPVRLGLKDGWHSHSHSEAHYPVKSDPFQPLVNQGYPTGSNPEMGPVYGQYPQQGQPLGPMGNTGGGYEAQQGFAHPGSQPGQVDPRLYQAHQARQVAQMGVNQQGQVWGNPNLGVNYSPAATQTIQGQSLYAQQLQGQPQYGYVSIQHGVSTQNDTIPSTDASLQPPLTGGGISDGAGLTGRPKGE
ncbi:hypothetical protein PV08_10068 [Exophiala spinifera]|uniref:Uncharacterized protein n=1 Tax=Exophiala spinifera TaxID=91928 RepID=A0A0D2BHD6_9EURO|nr:uncharacterized protein PV08_10068 [Exophiala spinifera]KIW10769.1 hypothetical protein PV08_10068 [Exophiala spinifera]